MRSLVRALTALIIVAALLGCQRDGTADRPSLYDISGAPRTYSRAPISEGITSRSFYVTMSDGVDIAVDLHLPQEFDQAEGVPAIVHQTRYWRSVDIRFPFNLFVDGRFAVWGSYRRYFVERGYAWIDVDVRGTGASFGTWKHSYWEREVRDGAEIVDWIVAQPWSNGAVGAWGISYAGGAAEFLLTTGHPAVKAAVPMFSPFDVYDDIAYPGGLLATWYVQQWNRINQLLDSNEIPDASLLARLAARGVRPVDGPDGRDRLHRALRERNGNLDVSKAAESIVFRDDSSPTVAGIDRMSPHAYAALIDSSGPPIYSYSGWYDGAYQHAAIRRFLTHRNPRNRLILGPWDHGGAHNVSPFVREHTRFDHKGEVLKFLDAHVMGLATGIDREERVHYYTMGAERWNASSLWPPAGSTMTRLFLHEGYSLGRTRPVHDSIVSDEYAVDDELGTGRDSRWTALVGRTDAAVLYPDREKLSDRHLSYTTPPLDSALEVTGHPTVQLFVSSSAGDGGFFVYLDDVSPDGTVHYVTEGSLRALHRRSIAPEAQYRDVVPVRLYNRDAAVELEPDTVTELSFDLLPISYEFGKGHSIRISISGGDADYFASVVTPAPRINVYRNAVFASSVSLPTRVGAMSF